MRLLRIDGGDQFSLIEFTGQDIPPYAILSHTWGPDHEEVSFHDIINDNGRDKLGYNKIRFCATQADSDGLDYFWVDTCCIDKSSSAELTESINSMYQWYKDATICYVALMDLPPHARRVDELSRCRWFTRGWTLQELLAPHAVEFYDTTWKNVGSKHSLANELSIITGIGRTYLIGGDITLASVCTKMSWAAKRQTKRIEDKAYSLLGLFDVNMPLIYGESMKAFRRLQEEIIKRNNDLTIFAWDTGIEFYAHSQILISSLAPSPAAFARSSHISNYTDDFAEFSITNKGLLISGDVPLRTARITTTDSKVEILYLVLLGTSGVAQWRDDAIDKGIFLRKIGPKLFCRDGSFGLETKIHQGRVCEVSETCILLDTVPATHGALQFRRQGIHVPQNPLYELRYTYPETLWDETDRIFLRPTRNHWAEFAMVLVMKFNVILDFTGVALAVLCHHRQDGPSLKICIQAQYPDEFEVISQAKYREEGIHVQELDLQARSIRVMTNSTIVNIKGKAHRISVYLRPEKIQTFAGTADVSTLTFVFGNSGSQGTSVTDGITY